MNTSIYFILKSTNYFLLNHYIFFFKKYFKNYLNFYFNSFYNIKNSKYIIPEISSFHYPQSYNEITILRSPHIYKKSKEKFIHFYYKNIIKINLKIFYNFFLYDFLFFFFKKLLILIPYTISRNINLKYANLIKL